MGSILNDGLNVLGGGTPRPATGTDPGAADVDAELVELVSSLTIDEIADELEAGNLTVAEVAAAEDPANGGRGRQGIRELTAT